MQKRYIFALEMNDIWNMDSRSLIKMLKKDGWELDRVKCSHHVFIHLTKKGIVVVPHPKKDIPIETTNSISKQAGLK